VQAHKSSLLLYHCDGVKLESDSIKTGHSGANSCRLAPFSGQLRVAVLAPWVVL
jgi:hypothetical protein